ncbi:MAG: M14 family metallopeptidase [Planctomycetota bacterium]|jgi:murein tripeptide amidase MpaA
MRILTLLFLLVAPSLAQDPILPPALPWDGASRSLLVDADDPWATPFERGDRNTTPRYDETVAWLERLCMAAPELKMVSVGKSHEGRDIWMVVASKPAPEPKPVLLAQAGIHAGEIDGKDAGMMLLRDMTVKGTKKALLDHATFLFIPILSVDGHERFGPYGRVNQRGPAEAGWRTNTHNLNLNRDYSKLDTPGLRAALKAIRDWKPHLYLDLHVTDGADYQYDITWGYNGPHAHSPAAATWMAKHLDPALKNALREQGHIPGPLVFAVDGEDMTKGNRAPTFGPRYSNGYGDLRHLPTVLVENHSLKPYEQRVLGTYVLLEAALRAVGEHGEKLAQAIGVDRTQRRKKITLTWKAKEGDPRLVKFLGVEQRLEDSPISGGKRVVWTGKPVTQEIPLIEHTLPDLVVDRPLAYWIPPGWPEVVERLRLHGVNMERIDQPRRVSVTRYRIESYELEKEPFEGRVRVKAKFKVERGTEVFPPGSYRITSSQPTGHLAMALLEPHAPDSFFAWGFFHPILQRTEYIEGYVMEPMAARMLEEDPALKKAFERRLEEDEKFAKDPGARLRFFYEKTPYFDPSWRLYPIAREEA